MMHDEAEVPAEDIRSIANLASALAVPYERDPNDLDIPHHLIPEGYRVEPLHLDRFANLPRRHSGTVTLHDKWSFIDYVNAYTKGPPPQGDEDRGPARPGVAIFANVERPALTAILNYHSFGEPGWGDWRATYEVKPTSAWKEWMEFAKGGQSQEDFAEFLEQHVADVVEPAGADLLTIVQDLRIHVDIEYSKAVHTQSGHTQLVWNETHTTSKRDGSASGTFELPEQMTVSLTPFEGGEPARFTAWLRYRIRDGRCLFYVQFGAEVQRQLEQIFAEYCASVQEETGIPVWRGIAPAHVAPII